MPCKIKRFLKKKLLWIPSCCQFTGFAVNSIPASNIHHISSIHASVASNGFPVLGISWQLTWSCHAAPDKVSHSTFGIITLCSSPMIWHERVTLSCDQAFISRTAMAATIGQQSVIDRFDTQQESCRPYLCIQRIINDRIIIQDKKGDPNASGPLTNLALIFLNEIWMSSCLRPCGWTLNDHTKCLDARFPAT